MSYTKDAPAAIGPYSQGVLAGNTMYVSGQLGLDPETGAFPADEIKAQTRRSLLNIQAILASEGLTMQNVVKTTVLFKDISEFAAMNEVYAEFFTEPFPARSCVEVARLPKDVLIECEVIAEL